MDVSLTGFPKKLLVAVSVVVLVTMCIMPVETRSLEHSRRHRRTESMAQTKDTVTFTPQHRRRHNRRPESLTLPTKENIKQSEQDRLALFHKIYKKIMRKVKHTRNSLKIDKKELFEKDKLKHSKQAAPSWEPTVNFVNIHYRNYTRRDGRIDWERKFTYQMPKLYKSLMKYNEIFKRLRDTELGFPDNPFNSYKKNRSRIIQNTINNLNSTIEEVKDNMAEVGLQKRLPQINLDLTTLEKKVDMTQCLKNDYLVFNGYFNLISNWHFELSCPRRPELKNKPCIAFENKIEKRRDRMNRLFMNHT